VESLSSTVDQNEDRISGIQGKADVLDSQMKEKEKNKEV
jgi:hypothetical protein